MAITNKHVFQSAKVDGPDTTLVQPSNWNAEHQLEMATNRLVGRTTAGAGAMQEITVAAPLTFTAQTLGLGNLTNLTMTGRLTISAGTVALPAVYPTGDPNTGLYFPAADTVGLSAGGVGFTVTTTGVLFNDGSILRDGYAFGTTTKYTSGTGATLTLSARCRGLIIELIGGGGGGGGVDGQGAGTVAMAGCGGGGGYVKAFISNVAQTFTYTIGAAGAGATAGNNAGSPGGNTSITGSVGGTLTAGGGNGGSGEFADPGIGSTQGGTGGTNTIGGLGVAIENTPGGIASNSWHPSGARGPASVAGGTAKSQGTVKTVLADGAGNNADNNAYGTGGGGASIVGNSINHSGGNGAGGVMYVTELF